MNNNSLSVQKKKSIIFPSKIVGILLLILALLYLVSLINILWDFVADFGDFESIFYSLYFSVEEKIQYAIREFITIFTDSIIVFVSFVTGRYCLAVASENAILKKGGWKCSCGKVNYNYDDTCVSCGKTKELEEHGYEEKTENAENTVEQEFENVELLTEYKHLAENGVITQEDFENKKHELLFSKRSL